MQWKEGVQVKLGGKLKLFAVLCGVDLCLAAGLVRTVSETRTVDGGGNAVRYEERYAALTFDDGPNKEYTAQLLDGLKERGIRATFFLMGQNIPGNEALVLRMKEEGHLIGNHSYRHVELTKEGQGVVLEELEKTEDMICQLTGQRPQYVRPPFGAWDESLHDLTRLTPVLWSVDSLDWKLRNRDRIVKRVLKDVEDGDIILMHDIFPSSVQAALEIADRLTEEGYRFVTVDELLID